MLMEKLIMNMESISIQILIIKLFKLISLYKNTFDINDTNLSHKKKVEYQATYNRPCISSIRTMCEMIE